MRDLAICKDTEIREGRISWEKEDKCHDFDISAAMTTLISDPQRPSTTSYDLAAIPHDRYPNHPDPRMTGLKTRSPARRQFLVRKYLATLGVEPSSWPTR